MARNRTRAIGVADMGEVVSVNEIVAAMAGVRMVWDRTKAGAECEKELSAAYAGFMAATDADYGETDAMVQEAAAEPGPYPWSEHKLNGQGTRNAAIAGYIRPAVSPERVAAADAYVAAVRRWADRVAAMCANLDGGDASEAASKAVTKLWELWDGNGRTTVGIVDTLQAQIRNAFMATEHSMPGRLMLEGCLEAMGTEAWAATKLCCTSPQMATLARGEAAGLLQTVEMMAHMVPQNGQGIRDVSVEMADIVDELAEWVA